ncbi:flagellar biosynthesis protein FliR [Methylobacterium sp. Leaf85]|uniref:flagellar biosynthesis protein FliR n=1 Tax=Methylobacterium sp. Leaf85 TaxID=1736241 RepID=UPI0006F608FA|nr:flagellar biosynthesis protein FliR [Methylobacterium sp. Leaf85]KQO51584.1 flagellar biosynthetic protein FliR [Methylobacterium sp. Leaf85]
MDSLLAPESFLATFLIFCRIGGCLLVVPGFSSPRIPGQVRLLIALSTSLALTPLLLPLFQAKLSAQNPATTLQWIFTESFTGLVIGFLGRIFFVVLDTVMNATATMVGFGGMPGSVAEGVDPVPAVEALILMAAAALLFAADLHWELFRGLVDSYSRIPPGEGIGSQAALVRIVDQVTTAFVLGLRITSPFIVYAVAVNLAAGFTNKLVPAIPVFFIATPFIMAGGLLLLYYLSNEFMTQFLAGYVDYLRRG